MASGQPFRLDFLGPQRRELGDDARQGRRQIPHHQRGLEPEDSIPETPEHFITPGIGSAAPSMAFAVDFDDQARLREPGNRRRTCRQPAPGGGTRPGASWREWLPRSAARKWWLRREMHEPERRAPTGRRESLWGKSGDAWGTSLARREVGRSPPTAQEACHAPSRATRTLSARGADPAPRSRSPASCRAREPERARRSPRGAASRRAALRRARCSSTVLG